MRVCDGVKGARHSRQPSAFPVLETRSPVYTSWWLSEEKSGAAINLHKRVTSRVMEVSKHGPTARLGALVTSPPPLLTTSLTSPSLSQTMPPKAADKNQKTLNSWFSKEPGTNGNGSSGFKTSKPKVLASAKSGASDSTSSISTSKTKHAANPVKEAFSGAIAPSSSPGSEFRTPLSKKTKGHGVAVTNASESGGSSYKDTPPTSDPVDVDMLSPDEEADAPRAKQVSLLSRLKSCEVLT